MMKQERPSLLARAIEIAAGANPIARLVKLADLEDNMDLKRILEPVQKDFDRLAKYRRSWETLKRMEPDDGI